MGLANILPKWGEQIKPKREERKKEEEKRVNPTIKRINIIAEGLLDVNKKFDKKDLDGKVVKVINKLLKKVKSRDSIDELRDIQKKLIKTVPAEIQKDHLRVDEITGVSTSIYMKVDTLKRIVPLNIFRNRR